MSTGNLATPLLSVEDLTTHFMTPRGVGTAVDGVSFTVDRGETLGIVGESGSGKSALVRTIMGLLPEHTSLTSGRTVYDGVDLSRMTRRAARQLWGSQIAMIFQDPLTSLNPTKRIGAHLVETMCRHLKLSKREARSRAVELLEQVGIPEPGRRVDQYPHQFSGGMRQRVTIAMAIACKPRLLIADEPTTALDVTVQKQILDLLSDLQTDYQMGMLLITHDMGVVAGRADRVAVMYGGRIVESGTTRSVFAETGHPYTAGLLNSIPRLTAHSHERLRTMPGQPPDITALPVGCRFAPRCANATVRCAESDPEALSEEHPVACWHPLDGEGPAAADAVDGLQRSGQC